jgi:hypothetical protein
VGSVGRIGVCARLCVGGYLSGLSTSSGMFQCACLMLHRGRDRQRSTEPAKGRIRNRPLCVARARPAGRGYTNAYASFLPAELTEFPQARACGARKRSRRQAGHWQPEGIGGVGKL